ncbi:hypothetical protein BH20VER1_BH20VER1_17180 [soil metagenome]
MNSFAGAERAISLGALAARNVRTFISRGAKIGGPLAALCGIIADLGSTVAKFSLYLFIGAAIVALVSGLIWFLQYRRRYLRAAADGTLQPDELKDLSERNAWAVAFAFAVVTAVVMAGFVAADAVAGTDDRGVIASVVPGMDRVQSAIFRTEKKVDAIQQDTTAIRGDTARLVASVDRIAERFDALGGSGALITTPETPEEHYHNARIQELKGNFSAARQEYTQYLQSNLDVIDPWLNYATMLKAQEGRTGAIEALRYFGEKLKPPTVSYATALALLEERPARIARLTALQREHPEFGPLAYLLADEFSEAKAGEQTVADRRAERDWLAKFRAAHAEGRVLRYFIDQKEAQKWLATSDARWAKLESTPAGVLDTPVSVTAMQSNAGWSLNFALTDYKARELFYRLDGRGDFASTGHQPFQNPQTGAPMVNLHLPLPNLTPGEHTIEVKYTDLKGETNGPYTLRFSTGDEQLAQGKNMVNSTIGSWLSFREYDGRLLLYFTGLMTYRPILQEVRYSLDNDSLDQTFRFKPTDKMFEAGDDIYIAVPKGTQSATVQATFKDGTKSAVQNFPRVP